MKWAKLQVVQQGPRKNSFLLVICLDAIMLCHVERNDGCGGTQKWEENRAAPADGINLNREEFNPGTPLFYIFGIHLLAIDFLILLTPLGASK